MQKQVILNWQTRLDFAMAINYSEDKTKFKVEIWKTYFMTSQKMQYLRLT